MDSQPLQVDVQFNNLFYLFRFDTGATFSSITKELFHLLPNSIKLISGYMIIETSFGQQYCESVIIKELFIQEYKINDVCFVILKTNTIGMNIIQYFNFIYDGKIKISNMRTFDKSINIKYLDHKDLEFNDVKLIYEFINKQLHVTDINDTHRIYLYLKCEGVRLKFLLDTGAMKTCINLNDIPNQNNHTWLTTHKQIKKSITTGIGGISFVHDLYLCDFEINGKDFLDIECISLGENILGANLLINILNVNLLKFTLSDLITH